MESSQNPSIVDPNANHDVKLITIFSITIFLSLTAVLARLASTKINRVKYGVEEALIVIAWVLGTGETVMYACSTQYAHIGRHTSTLSPEDLVAMQKTFYAGSYFQFTSLAAAKLSVLILLRRIFITRAFRITIWILGGIVIIWWIAFFFAAAFICFPAKTMWLPNVEGTCKKQKILNEIWPAMWILTDFAILISPIPVIKQLQLPQNRKMGLYASFLFGGLTCIVSVVRYPMMFYDTSDVSWNLVQPAIWTTIEVNTSIICACIIASRPFFNFVASTRPFSNLRSAWSGMRSQSLKKLSNPLTRLPRRGPPLFDSTQSREPSPILPLFEYPRNEFALQKSTSTRNIARPSESSEEVLKADRVPQMD